MEGTGRERREGEKGRGCAVLKILKICPGRKKGRRREGGRRGEGVERGWEGEGKGGRGRVKGRGDLLHEAEGIDALDTTIKEISARLAVQCHYYQT